MSERSPSPKTVAERFAVRVAAHQAIASGHQVRTAAASQVRREFTAEVLESFGEAVIGFGGRRIEAGSLTRKMRQLWEMFQKAPREWERFKNMLGVKATGTLGVIKDLSAGIPRMIKEGRKRLVKIGEQAMKVPLIALYFDVSRKMPSVTDLLTKLIDVLPEPVGKAIKGITSKAKSFASFLDGVFRQHPALVVTGALISAAVFTVIWFNVVEISWDIPSILRGFLGLYSFTELLETLPESALGFLLRLMFPGIPVKFLFNALLPATIALRVMYLIQKNYLEYKPGKGFIIRWDKMPRGKPKGAPDAVSL